MLFHWRLRAVPSGSSDRVAWRILAVRFPHSGVIMGLFKCFGSVGTWWWSEYWSLLDGLPYSHYIWRLARRVTFTFHAALLILPNSLLNVDELHRCMRLSKLSKYTFKMCISFLPQNKKSNICILMLCTLKYLEKIMLMSAIALKCIKTWIVEWIRYMTKLVE